MPRSIGSVLVQLAVVVLVTTELSDAVRAQQAVAETSAADRAAGENDLDLPPLPPLDPGVAYSEILYSDRHVVPQGTHASQSDGGSMTVVSGFLPPTGDGGTGTGFGEPFWWGLPDGYDPFGEPVPLLVGYHGFGLSAQSVHLQSELDEECNARGWAYLSPTGIDDKLFGPPLSQRNTSSAIQWMLDNHNIDPDRIYMCGFSMGGGVVANYAARHRNPSGIMIAALGMVAASWDWTMTYNLGSGSTQAVLENAANFNGSPLTQPFAYQQASCLYFDPATYPPEPGTLLPDLSMARNLHDTPLYAVRDAFDINGLGAAQGPTMASYVTTIGGTIDDHVVVCCGGPPDNHSWSVLDEVELFDFLEGHVADRLPAHFLGLFDQSGKLSFVEVTKDVTNEFAYCDGDADVIGGSIELKRMKNVRDVVLDVGKAGLTGTWPLRIKLTNEDPDPVDVTLTGFDQRPAYLLDPDTSTLLPTVDSDPFTDSLLFTLPGNTTVEADVHTQANWTTDLWTSPNPAPVGGSIALEVDGPAEQGAVVAITIVSIAELLTPIKGGTSFITAALVPPSFIVDLFVDINGDVTVPGDVPNDPGFSGLRFVLQSIVVDSNNDILSISNLWGLYIE